jgi:hypothetical protein
MTTDFEIFLSLVETVVKLWPYIQRPAFCGILDSLASVVLIPHYAYGQSQNCTLFSSYSDGSQFFPIEFLVVKQYLFTRNNLMEFLRLRFFKI